MVNGLKLVHKLYLVAFSKHMPPKTILECRRSILQPELGPTSISAMNASLQEHEK